VIEALAQCGAILALREIAIAIRNSCFLLVSERPFSPASYSGRHAGPGGYGPEIRPRIQRMRGEAKVDGQTLCRRRTHERDRGRPHIFAMSAPPFQSHPRQESRCRSIPRQSLS